MGTLGRPDIEVSLLMTSGFVETTTTFVRPECRSDSFTLMSYLEQPLLRSTCRLHSFQAGTLVYVTQQSFADEQSSHTRRDVVLCRSYACACVLEGM